MFLTIVRRCSNSMPISSPQFRRIATLAAPVATLAGPLFAIFAIFYFGVTTTATKAEVKDQIEELKKEVKERNEELKKEVKKMQANLS